MIKYNNIICSIAKNRTSYLVEWIDHHLNIGVQYFIIYDDKSDVPVKQTLAEYIDRRLVKVIDCSAWLSQVKAYNHCLYQMSEKAKWIAFIDIDEFIILNKHRQMDELLKEYDSFGGLCLNLEMHHVDGHVFNPQLPVKNAFREYLPDISPANRLIKTILQPHFSTAMSNPHYAIYERGYYAVNEKYLRVPSAFSDFSNEVAHVNHFLTKNFEEWIENIMQRKTDENGPRDLDEFRFYNSQMPELKDDDNKRIGNASRRCFVPYKSINLAPSEWRALWSGTDREEIENYLNHIGKFVSQYGRKSKDLGLFRGQAGIFLFLFNLGKLTNDPRYDDWANEILENIIINIRAVFADHSFANGLCGIGWLIEYLAQNQFIENNTNEILSDLDDLFNESIFNLLDFSLTNGLISYGMYFLSRLTNPENFNVHQKEMVVQIVNYLECFLPDNVQEADEPENLTMLQGYLSVIPFLCKLYVININRYKVLCVIEKYVRFILSFESQQNTNLCFPNQTQDGTYSLQWNCGDLAVANALLQAAKVSENKGWENKALQIALRTLTVKAIKDPGTSLLSGTAGIAHLYNQFYQYYHLPEFKESAIFWLNKTMKILKEQEYDRPAEYGLIDGLAGTALVLLSSISEDPPFWDPLFSL